MFLLTRGKASSLCQPTHAGDWLDRVGFGGAEDLVPCPVLCAWRLELCCAAPCIVCWFCLPRFDFIFDLKSRLVIYKDHRHGRSACGPITAGRYET